MRYRLAQLPCTALLTATLFAPVALHAQATPAADPAADATPSADIDATHATPAELRDEAWTTLTNAATDKHSDVRIQAIAALGTIPDPRAEKMVADAMADPDLDVRTAAILAAGQSHSTFLIGKLHGMLDDPEPQVAFTAATTLWKLKDHSGEDILIAVAEGDRRASATLYNGAKHSASKDLHDPAALAKMGALQGASILLGPFGFGIGAIEAMRKNGGNSARVQALEQIAEDHTPNVRTELLSALTDKDPAVRADAARLIGAYPDPEVSKALTNLFLDSKAPVRYTAAASFLRTTNPAPAPAPPAAKPARPRKSKRP